MLKRNIINFTLFFYIALLMILRYFADTKDLNQGNYFGCWLILIAYYYVFKYY